MTVTNFPFWMRLLVVATLLLFAINLLIFVPWFTAFVATVDFKVWQTLVAGILALVGAIATVLIINAQIKQAESLEEGRRAREELAARAVLPFALSELSEYASECIKLISTYVPQGSGFGNPLAVPADLSLPSFSPEVIGALRDCVRFGDNQVVRQIATVLAGLQVQRARLRGLFLRSASHMNGRMSRLEGIEAMIDAAELYAKTSALFEYGREVADMRARSPRKEVQTALFVSGIVDIDHPEIYEAVARRYK
jgi:hypothetical protein